MKLTRRTIVTTAAAGVVALAAATGGVLAVTADREPAAPTRSAVAEPPAPSAVPYAAPSSEVVAGLPEARYDAVIAGLLPFAAADVPEAASAVYSIAADAPLYGDDTTEPVARLAAKNFLGQNTVVVPVDVDGDWTLILTPSRASLPSTDPEAPAQTAAWVRSELLTKAQDLRSHVVVSVAAQTVSIVDASGATTKSFDAGVGTSDTPTPTGVAGYLQARYLDPAQDQTVHPIQLTSLHSDSADEPYEGADGGLIGIHYQEASSGAVSHGCVRLSADAIDALNTLPLGTLVMFEA